MRRVSTAEYVDEWSGESDTGWFGSSIAKKVGKAAKGVAKGAVSAGKTVVKAHESVAKAAVKPLSPLMRSPVWNIAQTGASFIPGVGQAVSGGMAAAAALGRGESLKDAALKSARAAIPGGPVAQAAFDIAVGAAKGQRLDDAALAAVREQVPGGELGRAAFDAGLAVATGKRPPTLSAVGQKVMSSALAVAGRSLASKGPLSIPGLPSSASKVVQALAKDSQSRGTRIAQLATGLDATALDARKAAAALITRHAGRGIDWRDIGEGETIDVAARRLGVQLPADLARPAPSALRHVGRRHVIPPVGMTRRTALAIFERGTPELRKAILAHGLLSELARNAGELGADGKWTIRSGEYPSTVAQKVTGDAKRWHELPAVNPGMTEVHKKDSSGKIIWSGLSPWNVGQKINLPPSWVAATLPQLTTPAPTPASSPSSSSSLPGGPPFPPPSQYPAGYPSPIYVVQAGDYGSKIAERITGNAGRWTELRSANPTTADPKVGMKLYAGQKLQLPPSWVKQSLEDFIPTKLPQITPQDIWGGTYPATSPGWPALPTSPQSADPLPHAPATEPDEDDEEPATQIVGTPEQIGILQIQLGYFYKQHPEATWSMPGEPYGSKPTEFDGDWGPRSTAAMAGFQAWWNKAHSPKLATTGLPDAASVAALQQQTQADLAAAGAAASKLPTVTAPSSAPAPTGPLPTAPPALPPSSSSATAPAAEPQKSGGIMPLLLVAASLATLLK